MKDIVAYVFLFALYFTLALNWVGGGKLAHGEMLGWSALGQNLLLFAAAATLARWSILAFKPRRNALRKGQKIVGVEEPAPDSVIDVVQPQNLKRETQKPKLKRRRLL